MSTDALKPTFKSAPCENCGAFHWYIHEAHAVGSKYWHRRHCMECGAFGPDMPMVVIVVGGWRATG